MLVEQAIFTSLKTRRQEGYQLAATSPGITSDVAKELAHWGPAHDSLVLNDFGQTSINFHPLDAGGYCLSRTVADGDEYSGRGGPRIYTQMFVVPEGVLARFANQPLAVLEALAGAGHIAVHATPPEELPSISLVGRAGLVNQLRLAELAASPGIELMLGLLELALTAPRLALRSPHVPLERLFSGLLWLLPPNRRLDYSFSSGLRFSPRRPVRWIALPPDASEQRNLTRSSGATSLDLERETPPPADAQRRGWAYLVRDVLHSGHASLLPELLRRADAYPHDLPLDTVAERVEAELSGELSMSMTSTP